MRQRGAPWRLFADGTSACATPAAALLKLLDSVVGDREAKKRAGKRIGGIVRLQRDARETHQARQAIRHPFVFRVAVGKNRGHGKSINAVPAGKAADASEHAS